MHYEKKYWSNNEFHHKNGEAYNGYVGICNSKGYVYDTEEPLIKNDSYLTQINSSEHFYDRILDEEISLPWGKQDIQFAANDFLSTHTLKNIILRLQQNNDYIFKNAIISNTLVPNTNNCSILATYNESFYVFVGRTGKEYVSVIDEAALADIKNNYVINRDANLVTSDKSLELHIGDIPLEKYEGYLKVPTVKQNLKIKSGYLHQYNLVQQKQTKTALDPIFYPQYDELGNASPPLYNFNDIVHAEMTITKVEETDSGRKLHLMIFFLFSDKLVIFPYIYYQNDTESPQITLDDSRYPEINFNPGSTDIIVLDSVDPNNKNSLKFLGLKDIELHGNYMYLVDQKLNAVFRYDIAYLLNDESDIAFNIKSIRLLDHLQGDGSVNDNIYFNAPVSVAVDDDWIYIADKGNSCIKKYTASFDYEATLRNSKFINHSIETIAVNPYSFELDGVKLAPGSLWIFSTNGIKLFVTVMSNNTTVYYKPIDKIELLKDQYTWDEEFKSVKFSFTNSNYYYISTTKRIYKIHLSKPSYPFASLSYYKQRSLLSTMVWNSVPYPWHTLPDGTTDENVNITWSYRPQKTSAEILDNRAFCIAGVDSSEIIENGTKQKQFNGDLILHIGNLYDQSKVDTYIKRHMCSFNEIPEVELATMLKASGIFLYHEPATFISSISNPSVPCYINEDLQDIKPDEYVNAITFNAHIYKVIYNLINIKNTLLGRFQGAYNMDNLMVYDQLILDNFFQQLKIENKDDYFIHDNEPVGIIVNRVFEKIWDIQHQILRKMEAKYISTPSFNNNTFRII